MIGSCLVGWGYYYRWCCNGYDWYLIPIKIWKCRNQKSGGYISIQPTFLLPYRQYAFSVIYRVLRNCRVKGKTIQGSLKAVFREKVRPSYQTAQGWIKVLTQRSGVWIGLLKGEMESGWPRRCGMENPEYLMVLLEEYFAGAGKEIEMAARHGKLIHLGRGSPFSAVEIEQS